MRILERKIMRGPNFWSEHHNQLIVLKLDAGEDENLFNTGKEIFFDQVKKIIPSLSMRSKDGRLPAGGHHGVAHVVERLAIELQLLSGMNGSYGRTYAMGKKGYYRVVFSYELEKSGLFAAEAAVDMTERLLRNESYDIEYDLRELSRIRSLYAPGPTTAFILEEVQRQRIPYKRFGHSSLVMLGYGHKQKKMRTAVVDTTSALGLEIAGDKEETKQLLYEAYLPVPRGITIRDKKNLEDSISRFKFPLVIKPINGNHGRGVTTDIKNAEEASFGFDLAKSISDLVIIEEFIKGNDYRMLVVNYKLIAVAMRTPAFVTGDGYSTIAQLIEQVNQDPERGDGPEHVLAPIRVDEITRKILNEKKLAPESVLPEGKVLYLKDTANISMGGTSTDVTDIVHPENVFMAERVAKLFSLDICGLDVIAKDISEPLTRGNGAIIEVNAGPGLRMHTDPGKGVERNVAKPIIDMLFPKSVSPRIPVVAIAGTAGKTTTAKLISNMAIQAGYKPGYAGSDGAYLLRHQVTDEDSTDFVGARTVLFDPTVNFAVLECSEEGIWDSGLGFDHCDISIITNISDSPEDVDENLTHSDLVHLAGVVTRSTFSEGYAILNADDDRVYNMRMELGCRIALFSMDENSERVREHCDNGGLAALVEEGQLMVYRSHRKLTFGRVTTLKGKNKDAIRNVLPAVLVGVINGFDDKSMYEVLRAYVTPGSENGNGYDKTMMKAKGESVKR